MLNPAMVLVPLKRAKCSCSLQLVPFLLDVIFSPFHIMRYRQTRRRREHQARGAYAVNVSLQQNAATAADTAAAASDNWAFVYDVNASSTGYASLPANKYEYHATFKRTQHDMQPSVHIHLYHINMLFLTSSSD